VFRLRKLGLLLMAMTFVACGLDSAAPVNVEATVQARVSATVGAALRAQPTATRPPPATTVIPIGSPSGSAAASPALSPAPNQGVGTPFATAGTTIAGTGTPGGTGTPLRTSTPGGSATAGTTATPFGTPAPTPAPPLVLGAFARFGSYSATIVRYEWSITCPGGGGRAAPGAKFVLLQAVGRNDGGASLSAPQLIWALESAAAGASQPCQPEGRSYDEACARGGALPAGARCEGWLLFEVPEALEVPGALVTARQAAAPPGSLDVGRWRLPA
jgi:hypothetical protein